MDKKNATYFIHNLYYQHFFLILINKCDNNISIILIIILYIPNLQFLFFLYKKHQNILYNKVMKNVTYDILGMASRYHLFKNTQVVVGNQITLHK